MIRAQANRGKEHRVGGGRSEEHDLDENSGLVLTEYLHPLDAPAHFLLLGSPICCSTRWHLRAHHVRKISGQFQELVHDAARGRSLLNFSVYFGRILSFRAQCNKLFRGLRSNWWIEHQSYHKELIRIWRNLKNDLYTRITSSFKWV